MLCYLTKDHIVYEGWKKVYIYLTYHYDEVSYKPGYATLTESVQQFNNQMLFQAFKSNRALKLNPIICSPF